MSNANNVVEVLKTDEKVDMKSGIIIFSTNIKDVLGEGEVGMLVSEEANEDKVIMNPLYIGGELTVKMKIISLPAKKFEKGEKIANLLIMKS